MGERVAPLPQRAPARCTPKLQTGLCAASAEERSRFAAGSAQAFARAAGPKSAGRGAAEGGSRLRGGAPLPLPAAARLPAVLDAGGKPEDAAAEAAHGIRAEHACIPGRGAAEPQHLQAARARAKGLCGAERRGGSEGAERLSGGRGEGERLLPEGPEAAEAEQFRPVGHRGRGAVHRPDRRRVPRRDEQGNLEAREPGRLLHPGAPRGGALDCRRSPQGSAADPVLPNGPPLCPARSHGQRSPLPLSAPSFGCALFLGGGLFIRRGRTVGWPT